MIKKLTVSKRNLLLLAGLVWAVAGLNIVRLGILAYPGHVTVWNLILSVGVYAVFMLFVFAKMVRKHTHRISNYPQERQFFLKFFDVKGFCIMAFMMTFGIGLRVSGLCPDVFIAVFYTGLGAALLMAGVKFFINFWKEGKGRGYAPILE